MFKKLAIIALFLFCLFLVPCSSVEADKASEDKEVVKTWVLPDYMLENLKFMQAEFNRLFEAKLNSYKSELRLRFKEFKDMPEDVLLVDWKGVFSWGVKNTRGFSKNNR